MSHCFDDEAVQFQEATPDAIQSVLPPFTAALPYTDDEYSPFAIIGSSHCPPPSMTSVWKQMADLFYCCERLRP